MNSPSKNDILRIKLNRAKNTLREANLLLDNNFPSAALNRLYYACFYAASALLFSKDIFVKTHSGVKQMLSMHFIKTGVLSTDIIKSYSELFRYRLGVDYDDLEITDTSMINDFSIFANEFILKAQKILEL